MLLGNIIQRSLGSVPQTSSKIGIRIQRSRPLEYPTINGQPVSIWERKVSKSTTSNSRTGFRDITTIVIAAASTMALDASCLFPANFQFVAAADHSGAPGAALGYFHPLVAGQINRRRRFNRFMNKNGAPDDDQREPCLNIGCKTCRAQCSPVNSTDGDRLRGQQYRGWASSPIRVNGGWIFQDDVTWLHDPIAFISATVQAATSIMTALSDAGTFTFSARQTDSPGQLTSTGNSFASFLLGAAYSSNHGIQGYSQGFRQPQHGLYFMDDWKVTPRLTVNLGMRWEIIPPFYEVTNRMSEVSLAAQNPEALRPGALVFPDRANNTYWRQILPRVGIAWHAMDKLVVRAGYGITSTPPIANNWGYGGFTYGFNASVPTIAGTSPTGFVDDPAIYLRNPYPSLKGSLPNTDPNSANYQNVSTTAPDANRPGYVQNYNVTLQYQLPGDTVLEAAFVGNKGTRVWGGSPGSSYTDYCFLEPGQWVIS